MKKKLMASLMIASIILPNIAGVVVTADDTDSQIQQKDQQISQIQSQQDKAKAEVDAIQKKVDTIVDQQKELEEENEKLTKESESLAKEINTLSQDIVARDEALKEQARSAQTDGSATSYISTILDSKSIVDAISRVNAMREIVSANNEMLEKQKADKEALAEKQKANQEAINTVWENKEKLAASAKELTTQQAELKVAQLNLEAEKSSIQSEKTKLLEQKAAAQEAAKKAAEEQAAYQAQQASLATKQSQAISLPAQTVASTTSSAASTSSNSTSTNTAQQSTSTTATVATSTSGNTYPIGECTWGVKQVASWVGNYWGNANQWGASAQAAGHSIGTTPRVGAVVVWPNDGGGYGHVAYVTAVSGSEIQVLESNYNGNRYVGNFRGSFNPNNAMWGGGVYYIYP